MRLEPLQFVPAVGGRDSCNAREQEESGNDHGDGRPDDSHATTSWIWAGTSVGPPLHPMPAATAAARPPRDPYLPRDIRLRTSDEDVVATACAAL